MDLLPIKRALISVTDKSGLISFAKFLADNGVEIVSTGGTKKALEAASIAVTAVSKVTGYPEILNGRVKTLHPAIHSGILADKDDPLHMDTLAQMGIAPFDLVCVNLYDFAGAIKRGTNPRDIVEEIDIGGPCLLRAAAKNFRSVLVLPTPSSYLNATGDMMRNQMRSSLPFRHTMAALTFEITSRYDALIADHFPGGD